MGHIPLRQRGRSPDLGMTATYTHTLPERKRRQLAQAMGARPANILLEARDSYPTDWRSKY